MGRIGNLKLAVIFSPAAGHPYAELRDFAREAERVGVESFWVSDHFFGGSVGVPDRDCLEAWTLLAALARDTTRIRLGVLVAAAQYRNPALLAKIVAGVDQMSGGRVEFGIGAGWKEEEYRAYGYEFPSAAERVEQLKDTLEICRRLWTTDRATYHGKHYRVEDAVCAPKPVQRPHPPIWVGGSGPRVMRLAARYADGFDLGRRGPGGAPLSAEEMAAALAEVQQVCEDARRERPISLSHWVGAELGGGEESKRQLLERIRGYEDAGLDRLLLAFPRDRAGEMIRRLGDDLLAAG
ncbi:MAG TPA: TIGR03560 family F420-dependent LLM class oxidoreductase [Candidatus Limnocylindria bacterium]|nr:TIGR03560 family F420-dependent LLM class oxidoreductase [Candidatus Limnocylindria bacterium]